MYGPTEFRALAAAGMEFRPMGLYQFRTAGAAGSSSTRASDVSEDADGKTLRGTAIVFNKRSLNLGGWFEIIRPEAVDRTLADKEAEVRALVDHETRLVLGNSQRGTLRMKKGKTGLGVEIDTPATSYARDTVEVVRRGDVHGMSFRFRALDDEWDLLPNGDIVRYVNDMRFDEVSIVTFPAYDQTDVEVLREQAFLDDRNAKRSLELFQSKGRANVEWLRRMEKLKSNGWQFGQQLARTA